MVCEGMSVRCEGEREGGTDRRRKEGEGGRERERERERETYKCTTNNNQMGGSPLHKIKAC